jgi:hypothetical protein
MQFHISQQNIQIARRKPNLKAIIILIVGVIIILAGGIIYYTSVLVPQNTYNQAVSFINNGKYTEARTLLVKIPNYKNVNTLQLELNYESKVYQCVDALKQYLKNSDPLQIQKITFYEYQANDSTLSEKQIKAHKENPTCLILFNAQNGIGGNSTSYALFSFSSDRNSYNLLGTCDSLDDRDNKDDIVKFGVCFLINKLQSNNKEIGEVDLSRVNKLVKSESYPTTSSTN